MAQVFLLWYRKFMRWWVGIFCGVSSFLSAFVIGNPGQPAFASKSILLPTSKKVSFRLGYLDDYVYSQHFGEMNFRSEAFFPPAANNFNEKPPVAKLSTNAAILTVNFLRKIDVYGIAGVSQFQMDEDVYTKQRFAWGVGTKWVIYTWDKFRVGCDFKYFQTEPSLTFLSFSGLPLDPLSKLVLEYTEWQGAAGFSYQSEWICPYLTASYLIATMTPKPGGAFLVKIPGRVEPGDAEIKLVTNRNRWGAAVGATLLLGRKGILALESRFINQNAINATLELRF